jgi:hypothetical protein
MNSPCYLWPQRVPDLDRLTNARLKLNGTPPASVTLGRVIYHPEGIVLPQPGLVFETAWQQMALGLCMRARSVMARMAVSPGARR